MRRFAQPRPEKTRWPKAFLALLRESYPDYELNRLARGTITECLRRVEGLLHSQSTVCHRGEYRHCFALSLTHLVTPSLNSPFWLGARFDHNRTIFWAFEHDLHACVLGPQRVPGLHSTHQWRAGTDDIVRKCTANAEVHLAPHYRSELLLARQLLLELLTFLLAHRGVLDDPAFLSRYRRPLSTSQDLSLRHLAQPTADLQVLPLAERAAILVASGPEKFRPHIGELESIYGLVERLAGGSPPGSAASG
jgi:hypothetical protein